MIDTPLLALLSDDEVLAEAKRLVANERIATAALLTSLMEIDARRLYLREGCSSLFTYCTQVLRLAEGAAYNRIEAARVARRFPVVLEALRDGSVTLTSIRLLAPHFSDGNHRELLEAARHQSKRKVELLVATLHPKPPVVTLLRKVPEPNVMKPNAPVVQTGAASTPTPASSQGTAIFGLWESASESSGNLGEVPRPKLPVPVRQSAAVVRPLTSEHYRLQVTISHETQDKLRRVQDLLRHTTPHGDVATILDRALALLLADLERRRCAATPAPRRGSASTGHTRYIPAAVRREVWRRDQGRCAFVGTRGRCRETGLLEFHHVEPFAAGGPATVANIELRCRAHNQYEASLFIGDGSDGVREPRAAPW